MTLIQSRPDTAMLLAAGLGTRMRPLTDATPKPMLAVSNRPMIDRAIDHLLNFGIRRIVVNLHYKGEQIRAHLQSRKDIDVIFCEESELLDTGGGIKNALPHLGVHPIFTINADQVWTDPKTGPTALERLAAHWDDERMDALMLMHPLSTAFGFDDSQGDFHLDPVSPSDPGFGKLARYNRPTPRPYVWMSIQIVKPHLYRAMPQEPFSNNLIWNQAEAAGRLYGLVHQGGCYQVGTPRDFAAINRLPEFQEFS